jgi:pyruvate, water dikinase
MSERFVIPFAQLRLADVPRVGGKNASLGEMIQSLASVGVCVPDGFAISADAFRQHLAEGGIAERIYSQLDALDPHNVAALASTGRQIREAIRSVPLPKAVEEEVRRAYAELSRRYEEAETDVAVRSSATAEDLPTASFAGQQETYLNVQGVGELLSSVRDCMASLFTDRAIVYRAERGFGHRAVALSVGVQKMVRSDQAAAGVIFTLDTESGSRDVVMITGAWGLGETVVQGRVNPDEFWVHKATLEQGFRPIIRRELGDKTTQLVYAQGGKRSVIERPVALEQQRKFVLTDDEVLQLARWSLIIEKHYSAQANKPTPMDLEWAKDGRSGKLFIVQARPETVHSNSQTPCFEVFRLQTDSKSARRVLVHGKSVGAKIAQGTVRVIHSANELESFQQGEVLVAEMTDPDWEPVLQRAAAVITDQGGRTCHAAIVSRELGISCVVGCHDATHKLRTGDIVTVSCAEGDEGKVYAGSIAFEREEIDPRTLPVPRVPVMLNIGNPENAFQLSKLPAAGVGLLRIEFVIASWIGIHPLALLHPEQLDDRSLVGQLRQRTLGFTSPKEFFIDRLATGIAQIAAAFFPRPVIVRFSDFKSNEYMSLLGGSVFEPIEHNPMIGFRGASRYYDDQYSEAFALECEAVRRVRNTMGLGNVKVMIPFCRTIEEGERVLATMAKADLARGSNGLEVYVMCEIPNNVILADRFSDLFDGFSIGSNDLTQLTLGVDRDSERLAHVFNEQDEGVKRMIEWVIAEAHKKGRKVGLCGQAPSDHPEFAVFLANAGIDSISVTSDALPKVVALLAQ